MDKLEIPISKREPPGFQDVPISSRTEYYRMSLMPELRQAVQRAIASYRYRHADTVSLTVLIGLDAIAETGGEVPDVPCARNTFCEVSQFMGFSREGTKGFVVGWMAGILVLPGVLVQE